MRWPLEWQKWDETKIFNYALILSLAIHLVTVISLSISRSAKLKESMRPFEVTYKTVNPKTVKTDPINNAKSVQPDRPREQVKKMLTKTATIPNSFIEDSKSAVRADIDSFKKQPALLDTAYTRPKVSIPVFKSEKMTNPQFVSYENKIRSKIRNHAYLLLEKMMTAENFEEGEVYLTFLIGSDGALREIKIIEERTRANEFLREVSLMSVKESNPFPPLPDNKYPEITYNITISYEIDKK